MWAAVSRARIIQYGLGPIGLGIAEIVLERGYRIVGAIDIDPAKSGRRLADLLPGASPDIIIAGSPSAALSTRADLVVHSTQSRLAQVASQLSQLVEAGLNVISTCEELAFPWYHHPHEASTLDRLARMHEVTVVGLGVNPGFVMDALPVILTAPCRRVERIHVERVVDLGRRRVPLQQKVGMGLSPEAFRRGVSEGRLAHVGLPQSAAWIAQALGWTLSGIDESIDPVIGTDGTVQGIHQVCQGMREGTAVITLDLTMAVDVAPHDTVTIDGAPPIRATIRGGIHGDQATCAIAANAIPSALAAPPGLLVATQLPPLHHSLRPSQDLQGRSAESTM